MYTPTEPPGPLRRPLRPGNVAGKKNSEFHEIRPLHVFGSRRSCIRRLLHFLRRPAPARVPPETRTRAKAFRFPRRSGRRATRTRRLVYFGARPRTLATLRVYGDAARGRISNGASVRVRKKSVFPVLVETRPPGFRDDGRPTRVKQNTDIARVCGARRQTSDPRTKKPLFSIHDETSDLVKRNQKSSRRVRCRTR